jgi:hypothetical protein
MRSLIWFCIAVILTPIIMIAPLALYAGAGHLFIGMSADTFGHIAFILSMAFIANIIGVMAWQSTDRKIKAESKQA